MAAESRNSVSIKAGSRSVAITNASKVLFGDDGITKEDLARYYAAVAGAMVPHVRGRPTMMQRFPDGIAHPPIVHQRAPEYFPDWISRATVPKRTGGMVTHVVIDNAATLAYLAGQAVITPHVWLSRADRPEQPDQIVFDLDPQGDDIPLATVAAKLVKDILTDLGLVPFLKTSGSRGLHVVTPIRRGPGFEEAGTFAGRLAAMVVAEDPRRFTTEFRKADRGTRLFVDIGRNAYGQMVVAPYAVRARAGAPVSTPIEWDELRGRGFGFTVKTVPGRIQTDGDPWKDIARSARSLSGALRRTGA
jgi:bifunctional non-homologous end joining protein LigD